MKQWQSLTIQINLETVANVWMITGGRAKIMGTLRLSLTFLLTMFLVTAIISCRQSQTVDLTHEQNSTSMPTQETNHDYYFEMNAEDLKKLSKNIEKIQIRDSLTRVIELLGEPTDASYSIGKQPPDAKVKKIIKYYSKIWKKDIINERHDRLVRFCFDSDDRLLKIDSNIEGIESR